MAEGSCVQLKTDGYFMKAIRHNDQWFFTSENKKLL